MGSNHIADWPFNPTVDQEGLSVGSSPYGDNWDILWIGHCGSYPVRNSGRVYHFDDPTVPPEDREFTFTGKSSQAQHLRGTRAVFEFESTLCTSAYAISHKGAVKMRKYLEESNLNIDVRMERLCNNEPSLTCLGVWPLVMTAAPSKSNIDHSNGAWAPGSNVEQPDRGVTAGPGIQYSARRNAEIIFGGLGRNHWIKQW